MKGKCAALLILLLGIFVCEEAQAQFLFPRLAAGRLNAQARALNAQANRNIAQANANFSAKFGNAQAIAILKAPSFHSHKNNAFFVPRSAVTYYSAPAFALPVAAPTYAYAPAAVAVAAPTCSLHAPTCTLQAPTFAVAAPTVSYAPVPVASVASYSYSFQASSGGCYTGF